MPTKKPLNPHLPPEDGEETTAHALVVESSADTDILDEEGEAAPAEETTAAPAFVGAESASEDESSAPFVGFENDPGLEGPPAEDAEGEEEAEAPPEPIVYRDLSGEELQAAVEATFFMHHRPISVSKLRELINPAIDEEDYRTAVSNLMATYWETSRGIELVEVANGFQLRTKTEHKDIIRRMYQIAPMKLTNAMLEVLAIAAYNQPLTREGIDKIRGVDSSHLLRVLLDKKMLRIAGKSDELGRPMLYGTTREFLELFGLRDLSALPSLRELEDMLPKNEVGSISEEEALSQEMSGIVTESKPLEFNDLELEDLEAHEAQKVTDETLPAAPHGNSRASEHSSSKTREEARGDLHLPPEIARRLTPGQEGNA